MLVVHPTSQCDICLDAYTWSTPAKAPHAIQCGHIFCYDCLRTVNPSNCPMCRKAFNPERIKKLHVDKAPGDGSASSSRTHENEFMRRVGLLFGEDADDQDVNDLVEEVTGWLAQNAGSSHQSLRNAITALHQYKTLQMQKTVDKETIERLRATHERHAHVKQKDLDIAMMVERNMLMEQDKMRAEYEAKFAGMEAELVLLREQAARIPVEVNRNPTTSSNPLPRPPEIIPLVTSLTREHTAASNHCAQRTIAPLGLGVTPAVAAAAPASQSRSSSGSSRARAPSVRFADPAPSKEPQSKYKVMANGEELRQENTRRPHLVVPGAPPSQRVIPPRLYGEGDSDITPRAPLAPVPASQAPQGSKVYWPPHLQQYAPKPGSPCVWVGDPDAPRERLPNEVPLESLLQHRPPAAGTSAVNPVMPPFPEIAVAPTMSQTARAAAETGSARIRIPPADAPVSGRSPLAWRPGPAHKEGYVTAYVPEIGISWIPEEQAAKLPVRARGTESRYAYVIAKEPSEVDDEWRRLHDGASPPPNPLQLTGVPEAPVAGPSTSTVQRGQYDRLPGTSTGGSALFLNPLGTSDRTITASTSNSNASLSGVGILAHYGGNPRTNRNAAGAQDSAQDSARTANDLGLNIASLPEPRSSTGMVMAEEPEVDASPALSWGTIPTRSSRNSSLGNLHLNNLPSPHPFARTSESLEQLPIGELNGGPIVLTDAITPRQTSSIFGDTVSSSGRSASSRDTGLSGLLLNPGAGSLRQVVTSLRDLEDVNRSLLQLADSREREPERDARSEATRSARPSNRHSRQPSVSGDDPDAHIGLRTGLTLYSSRAATNDPGSRSSNGPSPEGPSSPAQSRPRSGASTRSYAESTYSSHTHRSSQSAHTNSSAHNTGSRQATDRRARRGSSASLLDHASNNNSREPVATWTTLPRDSHAHGPSRGPYGSDSTSQKSQNSIPRSVGAMDGLGTGPGSLSSLLLSFDPPSTSSAVNGNGEEAMGIHAPRPVNGRRSSMFGGAWTARAGH